MKNRLLEDHIRRICARYQGGGRLEKKRILSETCADYRYSRKYITRLLNKDWSAETNRNKLGGRPVIYGPEVVRWLEKIWESMGWLNSKAMKVALPEWLPFVEGLPVELKSKLLAMSAATMDRQLAPVRRRADCRRRTRTRAPRMKGITRLVPQRPLEMKSDRPGYMQGDTVAHCGNRLWGRFAWTLNLTCELTGWSAQRAIGEKSAELVRDAIVQMRKELPFQMWGFHCDNGSEFLNEVLIKYFDDPRTGTTFTHGRPYRKNDQAHVEQKNFTHVRQLFGYERLEGAEVVSNMNEIYVNEHHLLMNFFVPQAKLLEKVRVGSRYRKKFDRPKTPYRRLMASKWVSTEEKERLTRIFEELNPIELQKSLEKKLIAFTEALKIAAATADSLPVKEAA